ncbi:MAG: pyruvate, phosphate dikinase [Planctomycetes bacterium]|nr:pyruvate, phosphate dikinase [Planctomycetota bacterium]
MVADAAFQPDNRVSGECTPAGRMMAEQPLTTKSVVAERLDSYLRQRPHFSERIHRELLMELHRRGVATINEINDRARALAGEPPEAALDDPNQAERERWNEREREAVESLTRDYVCAHFSAEDVDDLVNLALKREEVHNLEIVANRNNVSFRELADNIAKFCKLPMGESRLAPAEVVGTRVALTRHLVSDQLEFIGIAKKHIHIRDFHNITEHIIGSDHGMGRIGGKAGGMTLAHRILASAEEGKDVYLPVAKPESFYLRSDVIEDFLRLNRLDEYQAQKYKPIEDVGREYEMIKGVFRNSEFPLKVAGGLRRILEYIGTHPLIVRSSSLLEDRFGTAFSGKYASVFLANQGTPEQRLRALLGAVAEVYASIMAPDPILYRREHNLIDYVEEMAVLIQKVVGVRCGDFLLPCFAGVAFSRNEYRWSPRIKRDDGLLRLVMGLGTRAVDRSGSDYPRMVALSAPTLRPESTVNEIVRGAQQTMDVMDLQRNRLTSIRLPELLTDEVDFPMLDKLVSIYRDQELFAPTGLRVDADPRQMVITFDKIIRETQFVDRVRGMLATLEREYGVPIDMEFACDGERFYVLQCRTQSQAADHAPAKIPADIAPQDVVFDAHRYVRSGLIEGIESIVYVDPTGYDALPTREKRIETARLIGRVNHALPPKTFVLIGPGRWGSNDILLGVPVRYADISNCRMLIEVSRRKDGFSPEVSFGTHFFQDLVEANIHYLPLYPDEAGNRFNEAFLKNAPNTLMSVLPTAEPELAHIVHVVHVPAVANGRRMTIAMNGESDIAVAFLK